MPSNGDVRNEIRADFDAETIVVWQAYSDAIADASLAAKTFVEPFSFTRMTWIKPSFLWLMERSNWGRKRSQERILKVRMRRSGFDEALALGVLTHPEPSIWPNPDLWRAAFDTATVHVQWDPERTLRGAAQAHGSIQVGLSRFVIRRFVDEWLVSLEDVTPIVRKIADALLAGKAERAKSLLPPERVYPVDPETARRLGISSPPKSGQGRGKR